MSDRRPLGDEVLVHRAARRVAVQAAVAVALAIVLLVLTVTWVVVRGQARTADTLLRSTVSTADDAGDPPPGAWLVIDRGGQLDRSSGLPARLGPELAELRGRATAATRLTDLDGEDGRDYRVATERRGGTTVQVVLDLTSAHDDRTRLLRVMAVASLLGLLFAVLLGILLGRRAVRPLAEALRLQRTFVADASHELRTPLTLLSTRAQVLDRGLAGSEVTECVRQDSHGLLDDIERLGDVVEDLLLAADPRGQEARHPVDLARLVTQVVASAQAHADLAAVRLTADTQGQSCRVSGSETALRRAVLSLVDNAVDHTPASGAVTVSVRRHRADVVVTVADTGPGVSPGAAKDVLRRFHSGGQRAGRAHYGLGLALTHDVANRHGGHLRLLRGGAGATFELVLPALDAPG